MATKVHCKGSSPGYHSMRDLNEDSSSSSWPQFNGDQTITHVDGFMSKPNINVYLAYDKDVLKQKMLEHETVFRNQVYELHRVYRLQRNMMEEARRKELNKRASIEASSSSTLQRFQMPSNRHTSDFPPSYSGYGKTSIMGVEISSSPTSCMKINDIQSGQFLFQNQFLDSRPSKVRKKLFDLQLPAEVYIDCEDGGDVRGYKLPDVSRYTADGNGKVAPENRIMSNIGSSGVKVDRLAGVSASSTRLRDSVGLADLNEPIYAEESSSHLPVEFINGAAKGPNQSSNRESGFPGVIHDGLFVMSPPYSRVSEKGPASHVYQAGSGSNVCSLSQSLRKDKLPLPPNTFQGMLNPLHHSPGIYSTPCNREGLSRNGSFYVDFSDRNQPPHFSHFEPQNSHQFFNSPSLAGSHSHPLPPWSKPKSSFSEQIITPESRCNSVMALDRKLLPSSPIQDVNSRSNSRFGGEGAAVSNGFCHGSSLGSKTLQVHSQSAGFGFGFGSTGGDTVIVNEKQADRVFGIPGKNSSRKDSMPVRDFNLNEAVSSSSNEEVLHQDLSMRRDNLSVLPWLRPKPLYHAGNSSQIQASSNQLWCNREIVTDLNEPFTMDSTDCKMVKEKDLSEARNVNKATFEKKNIVIDINLPCEPDEEMSDEELAVGKRKSIACYIDLNSCASDSEDPPLSSLESKSNSSKVTLNIDLEAPVSLECEEDENKPELVPDDALKSAADIMFAISSSGAQDQPTTDTALADSLLWFFEAVSSHAAELVSSGDEFEAMTLQLAETEKESFIARPFVFEDGPDGSAVAGNAQVTRARRGQARRGRQRRDFQRDILPGLTSLSRHEVTEDLQTFGGLMKATGHCWSSGLARRNGGRNRGARGRRRAVALIRQHSGIEGGFDEMSLAGWGKTTRRPRRQRCPAGNPAAVALT